MLWYTEIFSKDFFEFGSFMVYEHVMFQLRKKNLNLTLDLLFSTFLKLVHVQIKILLYFLYICLKFPILHPKILYFSKTMRRKVESLIFSGISYKHNTRLYKIFF
jgi:hypothetical protein